MYGRSAQHGQRFDYTRRYQNDIVVYSENELRSVMGRLKRGTRVVVANEIYITKPIYVRVLGESQLKTTGVDRREVIVAGFGGGSLRVKAGRENDFALFAFGPTERSGVTFCNLYVEGFKSFIECYAPASVVYHADLSIKDCYFEGVSEVFSMRSAGLVYFTRPKITNNRFINTDFHKSGINTLTFLYGVISGNTFGSISGSYLYLNSTNFADNVTSGDMELNGLNAVIDGNVFRDVTFNASALKFIVTNNKFWQGKASLANAQGFICRNNSDVNTERDILTPGRVSEAGEVIGQTILDGVTNTFACTTSSTTYKQLNDDVDATKKPYISFYVPANRKITIRLQCPVEDLDTHRDFFFIRLTDVDDETSPASFAAFFNDEHEFQLRDDSRIPFVFEWYIDGTDPGINWTAGDLKTFWFQVKVSDTSDTVSFEGGNNIGPIMTSANGVSDDLNFVDMG